LSIAAPVSKRERFGSFVVDLIPTVGSTVTAVGATLFTFFYVVSMDEWERRFPRQSALPSTLHAMVYATVCAMPFLLNGGVALLMQRSRKVRLDRDGELPPVPAFVVTRAGSDAVAAARKEWRHYRDLAETTGERTLHFGMMYGATCSLVLAGVVFVAAWSLLFGGTDPMAVTAARVDGAYALGAATLVCVLRDFSRLVVRAAVRDGSGRVFAWSMRRLILSLLAVLAFVALVRLDPPTQPSTVLDSRFSWLAVGIAVAIVGERLLEVITEKLGSWFGAPAMRNTQDRDLSQLKGMTAEHVLRFEEAGIATVHNLALQATPRLYFQLPYSIREILDWQDQALLLDYFGPSRVAFMRENSLIVTMSDVRRRAERFVDPDTTPAERAALGQQLGFGNELDAQAMLERVHSDGNILRLMVFQETVAPPAPKSEKLS